MKTKEMRIQREKENCRIEVTLYEKGKLPKVKSKRQPMADISARMTYEWNKLLLDANDEEYLRLTKAHTSYLFLDFAKIRMTACALATNGRSLKVSDLTEEELIIARDEANRQVDKWIAERRESL